MSTVGKVELHFDLSDHRPAKWVLHHAPMAGLPKMKNWITKHVHYRDAVESISFDPARHADPFRDLVDLDASLWHAARVAMSKCREVGACSPEEKLYWALRCWKGARERNHDAVTQACRAVGELAAFYSHDT